MSTAGCITGRLACRQKVLHSPSFNLMWTFPCPGHAQCGQQLTVDWSRGSSYSKNLVASDMVTNESLLDFPLEEEEEEAGQDDADETSSWSEVDTSNELDNSELDNSSLREYG
nr:hypothetical protein BaRGS_011600 [Batillaria attramentaria]